MKIMVYLICKSIVNFQFIQDIMQKVTSFDHKALLKKQHEQKSLQQNLRISQMKADLKLSQSQLQRTKGTITTISHKIISEQKKINLIRQDRSKATKQLEAIKIENGQNQREMLQAGQEAKVMSQRLQTQQNELKDLHQQFPENKSVHINMSTEIQDRLSKMHFLPQQIKEIAQALKQKQTDLGNIKEHISVKNSLITELLEKISRFVEKQKQLLQSIKSANSQRSNAQVKLKGLEQQFKQKKRQLQQFQEQVQKNTAQRQDAISYLPPPSKDQIVYISQQGLKWLSNNVDLKCPQRYYFWSSDYKVQMPIFLKKSGIASRLPETLIDLFRQTVKKYGNSKALSFEVGDNVWSSFTYNEYYSQCCRFAKACIALGLSFYTAVMIIGFNSPEWAITFFGSMFGNFLPVGMYTTNSIETCEYIANHCEGQLVVVQDKVQLAKYYSILEKCQRIKYFVIYKQNIPNDLPEKFNGKVLTWKQFMQKGDKFVASKNEDTIEYRLNKQLPGNCCCFIYTSGTTGMPKAVMMSHDNLTTQAEAVSQRLMKHTQYVDGNGRILSYLPLSHLAALLLDLIGGLRFGLNVFFPHPSVLQNNMLKYLLASRPTIFLGVPRVWEKLQQKLAEAITNTTGIKKKLMNWAMSKGIEGTFAEIHKKDTPSGWWLAKRLYNKIKSSLGMEECQLMVFGAAPMKQSTRKFFLQLNFPLIQAYGMSQTSGVTNLSDKMLWTEFSQQYLKQAGTPVAEQQIVIQNQNHQGIGQICIRGRLRFMGYYKNDQGNKATIDKKGFVHSGDQGRIDSRKNVYITGRIKQLIITAGGENIPPVLIENQIIIALPIISQIIVVGDKRKYLTCLICLKAKNPTQLADQVVEYISKRGSKAKTVKEAIACPQVNEIIKKGIQQANQKAISNAQRVQKHIILPFQLTIETGHLTPTMKLKRSVIQENFKAEIDTMYLDSKL